MLEANAFAERQSGFVSAQPLSIERWLTGVYANWTPNRLTRVYASLMRNVDDGLTRRTYTSFEGRLYYGLPWGHRVSAHVRRSVSDGRYRSAYTDYRFGYSVPLDIPMPSTAPTPRKLSGRVYDLSTGVGIEGVLLHLGDRMTLTDGAGRYRFPISTSRTEYLRVNQRSIGVSRVPQIPMPVAIQPGETDLRIDLPITPGAALSGSATRFGLPGDRKVIGAKAPLQPVEQMRGVIVEARAEGRVFRTRTDERGRFTFINISPGVYTVRIVRASVPDQHRWESDRTVIELQPEDDRFVHFKLVPIRRRIRHMQGGAARFHSGSAQ
jgi:hypothetical protein